MHENPRNRLCGDPARFAFFPSTRKNSPTRSFRPPRVAHGLLAIGRYPRRRGNFAAGTSDDFFGWLHGRKTNRIDTDSKYSPSQGGSQMEKLSINIEKCDIEDAVIVKPAGSIDSTTAQVVERRLINLVDRGIKYLIIDFSKTTFISSSGVGILLGLVSSLREDNGDLVLMNVSNRIKEIFDILNISDYFVTIENIDQLREHIPAR